MRRDEPTAQQVTTSPVSPADAWSTSDEAESDTLDALHSFANIARELAGQPQRRDTQQRIVALAVKVVGCDAAVLSHSASSKWVGDAESNNNATAEPAVGRAARAVALLAGRLRDSVLSNDLNADPRWANARLGTSSSSGWIRSALAFHLQLEDRDLGMAVERERVQHLEIALASNRRIGAAVGIIMTRFGITEEQAAFDVLRITSQHHKPAPERSHADLAPGGPGATSCRHRLGSARAARESASSYRRRWDPGTRRRNRAGFADLPRHRDVRAEPFDQSVGLDRPRTARGFDPTPR